MVAYVVLDYMYVKVLRRKVALEMKVLRRKVALEIHSSKVFV